jgi:hypothetical protein
MDSAWIEYGVQSPQLVPVPGSAPTPFPSALKRTPPTVQTPIPSQLLDHSSNYHPLKFGFDPTAQARNLQAANSNPQLDLL